MSTIDKSKFQFVKRDDFASETIDSPAYSYWNSVFRQFFKKRSTIFMLLFIQLETLLTQFYSLRDHEEDILVLLRNTPIPNDANLPPEVPPAPSVPAGIECVCDAIEPAGVREAVRYMSSLLLA